MSRLERKTRTISLRISEQEYETLKNAYATQGARTLSEFARVAMHHVIGQNGGAHSEGLEMQILALTGKLAHLEEQVSRLARVLDGEMPDPGKESTVC